MTLTVTPAINAAVRAATTLPDLVRNFEQVAPDLAQSLETKPLLASKTPWGVGLAYVLGLALAHYGLALDPAMTQLVAGLFVVAGSYAMRAITRQGIAGVVSSPVPVTPAP